MSLVLSMALRFVPRFRAQLDVVMEAQKCVGRDPGQGSVLQRLRKAITVFSVMVTWALESAIETADSMRSRGYGLPGRTAFSIYRFDGRDRAVLAWLCFCGAYIACGWAAGGFYWRYFPTIGGVGPLPLAVSFQVVYGLLCLTPVLLRGYGDRMWRSTQKEEAGACGRV